MAESSEDKIQKHFQNVMLVGMTSQISKNYTYKCIDCSRHNGIKGACYICRMNEKKHACTKASMYIYICTVVTVHV